MNQGFLVVLTCGGVMKVHRSLACTCTVPCGTLCTVYVAMPQTGYEAYWFTPKTIVCYKL